MKFILVIPKKMLHMMEFNNSKPDFLIFACFVIVSLFGIYAGKQYLLSRGTKWMPIGRIKNIYIYPIEGGYRKEVKQVDCSIFGLTTSDCYNNIEWTDREYLIYSDEEGTNGTINLHNPDFVTLKTDILENIEQKTIKSVVYPDGTLTHIRDCGDKIPDVLKTTYGMDTKLRMGSLNNSAKLLLSRSRRYTKSKIIVSYNCLNPEYSLCSLVNDKSVQDVKHSCGNDKLTHLNFRPNFVIEAPKYCEDKIEFLKIGAVEFNDPLPCTVDEYVNIDPETGIASHNREPYLDLTKNRRLKDVRSDITRTSDMPVFGITLNPPSVGKIAVGDQVYAKYFERS